MPSKLIIPSLTITEMCDLFQKGTSIPELMVRYSLSRNKITQTLREELGASYTECAKHIIALSGKKAALKLRGRKNPHTPEQNVKISLSLRGRKLSAETRAKISDATRTRFERGTWTKEQQIRAVQKAVETKRVNGYFDIHSRRHSEWMKTNAPMRGKKMSEASRQKQRDAKKRFYENGGAPNRLGKLNTQEHKDKCRLATKRMWAEGKFTYGDGHVMRSKLEKHIYEQVLTVFPDAQHSRWLTVDETTYVFDILIPSKKMLIEVNGDYWHFNPRLYEASYYDKYRDVTAHEIWSKDAQKQQVAEELGYRVVTIWEDEATTFNPSTL